MSLPNINPNAFAPAPTVPSLIRIALHNRMVLLVAGTAIALGGLGLGWGWLTAIGLAPLILSVAPCLIMCAFGMCMMGKAAKSVPDQAAPLNIPPAMPEIPPQSPAS